ncbi:MAG: MoaD/ThiS family protein [Epsilonproteobacteria bacterium]|nr:MoaD/ThiS family protein [Campylobacterota bacterium]
MIKITFNAFNFLRKKLKEQNIPYVEAVMEFPDGYSAQDIIDQFGFLEEEVEAVMINRLVKPKDTILKTGDRVALLPPGTPGSYRLILGIKNIKK